MQTRRSLLLRWLPAILVLLLLAFLASRFVEWKRFPELLEAIDRSQLQVGDPVSVFGNAGGTCFQADTVIVLDES